MRVRQSPDMAPLKTFLKEIEMEHLMACGTLNEDRPTHVAQGSYRAMKAINELIEQCPTLLEKERRQ